ncbi:ligase-associated DNA damage response endonuclease PdeM [Silvimonas sp. JCM 19000]
MPAELVTRLSQAHAVSTQLAGETVWLLPQKALFWPAQKMLLVADVHFGKAAAYRALGQPVPHGTTQANLARLDEMLHVLAADVETLVFLGDFLHARSARHPEVLAALAVWRARWPALRLVLVRGNHDLRAGDPPQSLRVEVVNEPWCVAGLGLCHEPDVVLPDGMYGLCGHVHPAITLHGGARERMRLACFWFGERGGILPAFGEFTGSWTMPRDARARVWVVGGGRVFGVGVG